MCDELNTTKKSRTRFIDMKKHLKNSIEHEFSWALLTRGFSNYLKRKILKVIIFDN